MAALHSALHALGPCKFSDVPTGEAELDHYLTDLFAKSQLILESIPIQAPEEAIHTRARSHTTSSIASNSSEISASSARSAPPSHEEIALQKEWGKPIKLSAKENPLSISVYKLSGKDGHGAWFARRSVHEGISFERFKKGLEQEFPEAVAVKGPPGSGNVRGIGAERKVFDLHREGHGRVEVYQLSAQFPGPTTPRDFVTCLVTTTKGMKKTQDLPIAQLAPRHYMIISKPCDHPETQPRDGMIRGQYESVEFIREVPRKPMRVHSSVDLSYMDHVRDGDDIGKEAMLQNHKKKTLTFQEDLHESGARHDNEEHHARHRAATASDAHRYGNHSPAAIGVDSDEDVNPVEWIMITRSDPGGSVPRFMVERGTPGSIVADASKFLDWACKKHLPGQGGQARPDTKANVELAHIPETHESAMDGALAEVPAAPPVTSPAEMHAPKVDGQDLAHSQTSLPMLKSVDPQISEAQHVRSAPEHGGFMQNATTVFNSALHTYAPQVVLNRLPNQHPESSEVTRETSSSPVEPFPAAPTGADIDDGASSISSYSFTSAESHIGDEKNGVVAVASSDALPQNKHEKELFKLQQRRNTLDQKLEAQRQKYQKDSNEQSAKEKEAMRKIEEKHQKEVKKHEERHRKQLAKIEEQKLKEAKRLEEKGRKQEDKDERRKLTRERDEAREQIKLLKQEHEIWQKQISELQKQNTELMIKVGKLEALVNRSDSGLNGPASPLKGISDESGRARAVTTSSEGSPSQSSTRLESSSLH